MIDLAAAELGKLQEKLRFAVVEPEQVGDAVLGSQLNKLEASYSISHRPWR